MKKTNRKRHTLENVVNSRYYQMPKFLFDEEFIKMSNDAKVLYSLLRDRHDLSISNNWINENNEVFLLFTRKNMQKMLGKSDKTIKKIFDELLSYDLVDEERLGQGKSNRIYLKAVSLDNTWYRNNYDSGIEETPSQNSEEFRPNDTDINDTDVSETFFLSPEDNGEENKTVDDLKDERKKESKDTPKPNDFQNILIKANATAFEEEYVTSVKQALRLLFYSSKPLKINSMSIPPSQIREDLKLLRWEHIDLGIRDFKIQATQQEITYPVGYLSKCIYNAIFQGDLRIQSELLFNGLIE